MVQKTSVHHLQAMYIKNSKHTYIHMNIEQVLYSPAQESNSEFSLVRQAPFPTDKLSSWSVLQAGRKSTYLSGEGHRECEQGLRAGEQNV